MLEAAKQDFEQFRAEISGIRHLAIERLRALVDKKASTFCIQPEWVVFNQSATLGRGAYGTVVEAQLIEGPWAGLRVVAKRALDATDPPVLPSGAARIFASNPMELLPAKQIIDEDELQRAAEYLDVEARVNEMVTRACPAIAAPYLGEVQSDGRRWLLWELMGRQTLEEVLEDAEWVGSVGPLAEAVGVSVYGEEAPQMVVRAVAKQLLNACQALHAAGVCEFPYASELC